MQMSIVNSHFLDKNMECSNFCDLADGIRNVAFQLVSETDRRNSLLYRKFSILLFMQEVRFLWQVDQLWLKSYSKTWW